MKPQVVTQPPLDGFDDDNIAEFDDGDSDEEPDATQKKRPIAEAPTL